eukprot:GEMP01059589.1.p1 GENE.GEMP01059589.1~~GEMP01059589.1.p1  ORF type:complete len:341 (-),score=57.51 GEMP01059589.1:328-1350(-)
MPFRRDNYFGMLVSRLILVDSLVTVISAFTVCAAPTCPCLSCSLFCQYECSSPCILDGLSCKLDGGWNQWSEWSAPNCGTQSPAAGPKKTRSRACDSPTRSANGLDCTGNTQQTRTDERCVYGCTKPGAYNYDSSATIDNGSCEMTAPSPSPQTNMTTTATTTTTITTNSTNSTNSTTIAPRAMTTTTAASQNTTDTSTTTTASPTPASTPEAESDGSEKRSSTKATESISLTSGKAESIIPIIIPVAIVVIIVVTFVGVWCYTNRNNTFEIVNIKPLTVVPVPKQREPSAAQKLVAEFHQDQNRLAGTPKKTKTRTSKLTKGTSQKKVKSKNSNRAGLE